MELPLVCVVLTGCTVDEMLKDASLATAAGADLVEVRLASFGPGKWRLEDSEEDNDAKKSHKGGSSMRLSRSIQSI